MSQRLSIRVAAMALAALPMLATTTAITAVSTDAAFADRGGNGNGNGNGGNGNSERGGPPDHASAGGRDRDDRPGRGNGHGNGNGIIARALGGANASHASPQAFANASDNSMIGRLREVHELMGETGFAQEDLDIALENARLAQEALDTYLMENGDLAGFDPDAATTRLGEIETAQAGLDPTSTEYMQLQDEADILTGQLADYGDYLDEIDRLEGEVETATTEAGEAQDAYDEALQAENDALDGVTNPVHELTDEAREVLRDRLNDRLGEPVREEELALDGTGEPVTEEILIPVTE
ncbi:hypothetical protein HKCCE3408_11700 [Rhodobacterales bacterium HKCCE3408]|nr:hypothetical protein [Rhodobacterales bacterium HKCCE3408]